MHLAERRARDVFAAFQSAVDTWQPSAVADRFDNDVVYIGTGSYMRGRDDLIEYVAAVFSANHTMRWDLASYDVFLDAEPLLGFAAEGTITADQAGRTEQLPFRVTVIADRTGADWSIRHFHGSVPLGAFSSPE